MYAKCSVNTSTNIALIWNLLVEADSYWVTNRWAKSLGYSRYVPSTNEQAILGGIEPCGMRFYLSTQNRLQLKMLYFWNLLLNIFRSWLTIGNTNNGGKNLSMRDMWHHQILTCMSVWKRTPSQAPLPLPVYPYGHVRPESLISDGPWASDEAYSNVDSDSIG